MGQVNLKANATTGLVFGLGTAGIAAAGIWGSRYVSKLPNLPLKSAAVAGGASFLATFAIFSIAETADKDVEDNIAYVLLGIILGSYALTAVGNKTLVDRDITILSSTATCAVSQIIVIAFLACLARLQTN